MKEHELVTQATLAAVRELLDPNSKYSLKNPEFMTTKTAARYLEVSRQYLEIARYKGNGPPYTKVGGLVRYKRSNLDDWMLNSLRSNTAGE